MLFQNNEQDSKNSLRVSLWQQGVFVSRRTLLINNSNVSSAQWSGSEPDLHYPGVFVTPQKNNNIVKLVLMMKSNQTELSFTTDFNICTFIFKSLLIYQNVTCQA